MRKKKNYFIVIVCNYVGFHLLWCSCVPFLFFSSSFHSSALPFNWWIFRDMREFFFYFFLLHIPFNQIQNKVSISNYISHVIRVHSNFSFSLSFVSIFLLLLDFHQFFSLSLSLASSLFAPIFSVRPLVFC